MRWLKTFAYRTGSVVIRVSKVSNVVGIIGIATLMLLITSDVFGRYLFNSPITGTAEISEYVMIIAVYCSMAYCAVVKGHVSVDLLVSKLPWRGQAITDSITGFFSLALVSLLVWASVWMLVFPGTKGEVSVTLEIPAWPFRIVLLIGIVMLCLVLLIDFVQLVARMVKK